MYNIKRIAHLLYQSPKIKIKHHIHNFLSFLFAIQNQLIILVKKGNLDSRLLHLSVKFLHLSVISCHSKIFGHSKKKLLLADTKAFTGSRTCVSEISPQGTSASKNEKRRSKRVEEKRRRRMEGQEKWLLWVFLWQCLSWLLWGVRTKQSASILPQKLVTMRSLSIFNTETREKTELQRISSASVSGRFNIVSYWYVS